MPMERLKGTIGWVGACYGVDLSEETAGGRRVIARAERSRGNAKWSSVAQDDPAFRTDVANDCPVVACLSVRESFTRWLSAPLTSPAKARSVLPTLLDIQLPFALEDCACQFLEFGREDNSTHALAVAGRHADIRGKLDALAKSGLDPLVLDHEGLAVWTQSLWEWPAPPDLAQAPRVVLALGVERCAVVLGRGERYKNAHSIRQADPAAIGRLLRAELGADAPVVWLFSGAGARDDARVSALHAALSASWPGPRFVHADPETFLARALATRALLPGPLRCNLRSGILAHPALIRRSRRQAMRAAVAALLAGLFLAGVSRIAQEWITRAETRIDRSFATLRDRLMGCPIKAKGQRALDTVRLKLQKDKDDLRPFVNALGPSLTDMAGIMSDVARKRGLAFDAVSLSPDRIAVEGTAEQWDGCDELVKRLRAFGYPVRLERQEALSNGRIPFTLKSGGDNG
ncbi:MAG: hypothetical protein QME60_04345 [Verrucomicrobiota bacterium]|nr:hypothetical protein [Verrucomicrobiota bacterium]